MRLKNWKTHLGIGAAILAAAAVLGSMFAEPVWAQVRAALVRDVDAPALAPFTTTVSLSLTGFLNRQALLTTVPAGKRLVIEHVSYWSGGQSSDELIWAALRTPEFGTYRLFLQVNPPHASATLGFTIQDGSQAVKAYFEAGEPVWLSASHSSGGSRTLDVQVSGFFITP